MKLPKAEHMATILDALDVDATVDKQTLINTVWNPGFPPSPNAFDVTYCNAKKLIKDKTFTGARYLVIRRLT
jgi:hypothetical protein